MRGAHSTEQEEKKQKKKRERIEARVREKGSATGHI